MTIFVNLKLRSKIFIIAIIVILLLAGTLTTYSIVSGMQDTRRDIEAFRNEELAKKKQNLKSYVDIAYETILSNYEKTNDTEYLEDRYGTRLRSIVDVGESIIRHHMSMVHGAEDEISAAQNSAMIDIKNMRYDSGTGYLWINDTTTPVPIMVMHPTLPRLDGEVLDEE
ncbi:MAG: hypothetical protein CMN78_02475 [Spirochaetales bacterium]|nr:hypothetical protein [Spirochaetales bacterium]